MTSCHPKPSRRRTNKTCEASVCVTEESSPTMPPTPSPDPIKAKVGILLFQYIHFLNVKSYHVPVAFLERLS
jgi:hypothetical protein